MENILSVPAAHERERPSPSCHPLSVNQQALWFLHRINPGSVAYNVVYAARIPPGADLAAMGRAFQRLVDRHPMLRTTFTSVDGRPGQQIYPQMDVSFRVVDAVEWDEAALDARLAGETYRPFNLEQGPLFHITVFDRGPQPHLVVLAMHHIISDMWSLAIILAEFGRFYRAEMTGQPAGLKPPRAGYVDFVQRQAAWLESAEAERDWAYWRRKLSGDLPVLDLPTDRPRTAVPTDRGGARSIRINADLTRQLRDLAARRETTPYTVVLAAYQTLLHRYTGQTDILVGSSKANRSSAFARVIGYFVNQIVLRANFDGDLTFADFLTQMDQTVEEAFAHDRYPLPQLVQRLRPDRALGGRPLFSVVFDWRKTTRQVDSDAISSFATGESGAKMALSGFPIESVAVAHRPAPFDWMMFVAEAGDELGVTIEYDSGLFDPATIDCALDHFHTLLQSIVAVPEQSVSRLPLLTPAERRQILTVWGAPQSRPVIGETVLAQFARQAAATPDAAALIGDGRSSADSRSLTFADLDRRSNQLAHHLLGNGLESGALVALCGQRSPELFVALLATLKAGGAYLPLDPSYPSSRLQFMLADSRARMLLIASDQAGRFSGYDGRLVQFDAGWDAISREPTSSPDDAVSLDSLAYILYTSGSSGRPKGVAMHHRPLANLIRWQQRDSAVGVGRRTAQFAPVSFDVSFQETFATWCAGGALVVVPEPVRRDPEALLHFLAEQAVERLFLPFVALQQLAEAADSLWGRGNGRSVPPLHLREIITAGEQLQVTPPIRRLFDRLPGCILVNQYGPTESHVVTAHTLDGEPAGWPPLPPIGRPIDNVQILILDQHRRPVPVGVHGELYIGGVALAHGYLDRPELTAERFIYHDGRRLYRTGDLARFRSDGHVEFIGRTDNQVKIRGFRVELGEVESALSQHPAVRQAAVALSQNGRDRLVAFIVGAQSIDAGALRHFLRRRLPEYMIPTTFVELDALPLTPSGKTDRRALPEPTPSRPDRAGLFSAPQTPLQAQIAAIWAELLGMAGVGMSDNFFELGGHSLLATQLTSRIRRATGVDVPLRVLFESPTVAGLAERVAELQNEQHAPLPPVEPAPRDGRLPLSLSQERMWFLHQLDPHGTAYNIAGALQLNGRLDVAALRRSLAALVARHEALRTSFAVVEGEPVQVIAPPSDWELPVVDLSHLPPGERLAQARALAEKEAGRPFDLSAGPLLKTGLYHLDDDRRLFFFSMHHIISDAWSLAVFAQEMMALYDAYADGRLPDLPPPAVQFADYAVWQREWLAEGALAEQRSYWRRQLKDAPILELPTDRPRPSRQSYAGSFRSVDLDADLMTAVRDLSHQAGATPFMTFLAAFKVLLHRYTSQSDIAVGTPIANRNHLAAEQLIGSFVNTLVLRTDLSGEPTFDQLLARLRQTALEAYGHQDMPFAYLVADLQPERDMSRTPLVQVMFNMINVPMPSLRLGDLTADFVELDRRAAQFDLTCTVTDIVDMQRVTVEYNTDLFDGATIERLLGHFITLLRAIVADPGRPIAALPVLTPAERRRLLVDWNDTAVGYPRQQTIHHLFEAQARRTPDATALIYQDEALSYRQLNEQANRLARRLQALDIGPGTIVGVGLDRSPWMVVGVLAALKAGAAYLPLDPAFPPDRLAFMLADAGARLVLADENWLALGLDSVPALDVRADLGDDSGENLPPQSGPTELAYVIYTSGSTGRPKGVQVTHRSVVNFLTAMRREPGLAADDVLLSVTTLSFDIAVLELFLPLTTGARVVLVDRATAVDGRRLAAAIEQNGATVMQATPATWRMLVEVGWQPARPDLKILCGGEALPPDLAEALLCRAASVWNMYGPTETTVWSAVHRVETGERPIPIGRPIANTRFYVLDAAGGPVPIGAPGELHIGGDGVSPGYLGRPELTAERFIPDPFDSGDGRLYRTGDLVRALPDGELQFLGRIDFQVKVRGFRIELGEIEAALVAHPAVRQAIVIARELSPGDHRLFAYLLPAGPAAAPSHGELADFLRRILPEYMIPSAFVFLDAYPLTPNNKIDRRALPEPQDGRLGLSHRFVPPTTPLQQGVAQMMARLLGLERVGLTDDFFALGGHSLLAVRLMAEIEERYGRHLPVTTLFEAPTVERLAVLLAQDAPAAWSPLVPIQPSGERLPFYCVHGLGGGVIDYRTLAHVLGPDQPFYGLQARGVERGQPPHSSIEMMAADFVAAIRAVQPEGPYCLGGYSYGGTVAFEMASQLAQQGQDVALLAMFDHPAPKSDYWQMHFTWRSLKGFVRDLPYWLVDFLQLGAKPIIDRLKRQARVLRAWTGLNRRGQDGIDLRQVLDDISHIPVRRQRLMRIHLQATQAYRPRSYPGRVTVLRTPRQPLLCSHDPLMGWQHLALGGVAVLPIAGAHHNLLETPHVFLLAEQLRRCLDGVQ